MVKTRYVGSPREREGGYLATHKRDFNAHTEGGDWFHGATDIQMKPPITSGNGSFFGNTIQETLESITNTYLSGGQGFITIGDGYNNCSGDLALGFIGAFGDSRLVNGGIVFVKAGMYCIEQTVTVPAGITIMGEPGGSVISQGNNLGIQEQPMFDVLVSTSKHQTGTVMKENQDKTGFVNIILYDNIHDHSSLTPFLNTISFIRCQIGSDLTIDNCMIIGKAVSTTEITKGVVEFITGPSTRSTILTVKNSYIDNVANFISFNGTQGATDFLTVQNNRITTYGTGGTNAAITTTNCNLHVTNNHHVGYSAWGAKYFIDIAAGVVSNIDTDFNLIGNSGGVDGGTPAFINNEPTGSKVAKNNTWGGTNYITTDELRVNSRNIIAGNVYVLQNSDYGTTLNFSGSRTVIDCRSVTSVAGAVGFGLTYTPEDGEEISLTIVNHATRTPSISRLILNSALFFKGTSSLTDNHCPDPRPGGVTNYKFVYNGISQGFDLISKTVSLWSTSSTISYDTQRDELKGLGPQKSLSAFPFLSAPSATTYASVATGKGPGRSVYSKNRGVLFSGGDSQSILYTANGSDWGELALDASIDGGWASRIAVAEEGATTLVFGAGVTGSSVRRFTISNYSAGPLLQSGSSSSIAISGSFTVNCILWQGPGSNRILVGAQNGVHAISPVTAATASTIGSISGTVLDMSRAPDGRIMAVRSNAIFLHNPTPGDFSTAPTFSAVSTTGISGSIQKVSFNRVLNRWFVITSTNFYYSDNNGSSWTVTNGPSSPAPGSLSDFQMVGNTNVVSYRCASTGWGGLYYWNLSDTSWKSISIPNSNGLGYKSVAWVGGKLVGIREEGAQESPLCVASVIDCGNYGPLDFDK